MRFEEIIGVFGISFAAFAIGAYLVSLARRKHPDALLESLTAKLPAWDCGLCGEKTCSAFARKLSASVSESYCVPGGTATEKRLAEVLGREPYKKNIGTSVAVIACSGDSNSVKPSFVYAGYTDCLAAVRLYGGPRACGSGCIGYGSCLAYCDNDAIRIANGIAVIDPDLCDGCGNCVSACPTGVIRLLPRRDAWYVACSSHASPEIKEKSCTAACTGCGACARRSAGSEFSIRDSLAVPSATTTGNWAAIAEDCPSGAIRCLYKEKKGTRPFGTGGGGL